MFHREETKSAKDSNKEAEGGGFVFSFFSSPSRFIFHPSSFIFLLPALLFLAAFFFLPLARILASASTRPS